ncbi:hypothetical protein D3C85_1019110 [compost metagenome]
MNGPVPDASAAKAAHAFCERSAASVTEAGTSASFFFHCAGEAMYRLERLMGRNESGSDVVSSTVRSSIFLADTSVGMRDAVTPTWLGSNCGALLSSTLPTFHTTASALKSDPSWNFTPGRSLKTHLVLSAASTSHDTARSGISTLAPSVLERSHCVRPSYIGMPVNRLPSKPWSGWPSVRGMSPAVMPMRNTFSACAAPGAMAATPAAAIAMAAVRDLMRILRVCIVVLQCLAWRGAEGRNQHWTRASPRG